MANESFRIPSRISFDLASPPFPLSLSLPPPFFCSPNRKISHVETVLPAPARFISRDSVSRCGRLVLLRATTNSSSRRGPRDFSQIRFKYRSCTQYRQCSLLGTLVFFPRLFSREIRREGRRKVVNVISRIFELYGMDRNGEFNLYYLIAFRVIINSIRGTN